VGFNEVSIVLQVADQGVIFAKVESWLIILRAIFQQTPQIFVTPQPLSNGASARPLQRPVDLCSREGPSLQCALLRAS
jgi:hypothetical protein